MSRTEDLWEIMYGSGTLEEPPWDGEFEYDDEPVWTEEDHAWGEDRASRIRHVEGLLGRPLSRGEQESLMDQAVRADTLGEDFNAIEALDGYYAEQGLDVPNLNTTEGRRQHMATRIAEETALKEEEEADEAEPSQFKPNLSREQRAHVMAARMEHQHEGDDNAD